MHIKLDYKRTALVGLSFLTINAVWQLYNTEIPIMLTKMIGEAIGNSSISLPLNTIVNTIMSVDNLLALFMLPFLGRISDKTNSRFGKRTPYIVIGVIATAIFLPFVPLFYAKNSLVGVSIMLGGILLSMSIYRSPAVALMPDVTPKPLRSKANAIINLMGAAGNVIVVGITWVVGKLVGNGVPFYTALFMLTSVVTLISLLVFVLTVNEPKLLALMPPEVEEEEVIVHSHGKEIHASKRASLLFLLIAVFMWYMAYGCIETNFSRYAIKILGMEDADKAIPMLVAMVAAFLCFFPLGLLSSKIGRKKTVIAGVGTLLFCAVLSSVVTNIVALYVFFALIGISWAAINVNSYPMVVEMARDGDIGKYTGIYYTFQMAAQIITPILSGLVMDFVNGMYYPKGTPLDEQMMGLRILFPYAAIFLVVAFVVMFFVRHGDAKESDIEIYEEKMEELAAESEAH